MTNHGLPKSLKNLIDDVKGHNIKTESLKNSKSLTNFLKKTLNQQKRIFIQILCQIGDKRIQTNGIVL